MKRRDLAKHLSGLALAAPIISAAPPSPLAGGRAIKQLPDGTGFVTDPEEARDIERQMTEYIKSLERKA